MFTLKYQNRMITKDGDDWIDQDGDRAIMNDVEESTVKTGYDLWKRVNARVHLHAKKKLKVAIACVVPKTRISDPKDVDMSDLDEVANNNRDKGWMSLDVICVSPFSLV